jgi:nucleoid DNA-binding protein
MRLLYHKRLVKEISKELGVEPKLVRSVISSFTNSILVFIKMRFAVKIHGFFKLHPKKYIKKFVGNKK